MLNIGNKTFMNLQEAVGWLLENNALPFQSTADYVGETEIAMSTLVNPSPAKVRVGSLIFFADSKVATVIGVTSNSFIVSSEYNDLVDDIVYVSNVAINASGHLICTLSNGENIDAGLIKQVTGFSINASQHLIVTFNDGSTTDLGAIFSGNVNISGTLTATNAKIFENIKDQNGNARFVEQDIVIDGLPATMTMLYGKWSLSGSHLMIVFAIEMPNGETLPSWTSLALCYIPSWIGAKIVGIFGGGGNIVNEISVTAYASDGTTQSFSARLQKYSDSVLNIVSTAGITLTNDRKARIQFDLLIDNA